MKRLATVAALVAVFAIPAISASQGDDGFADGECMRWDYVYEADYDSGGGISMPVFDPDLGDLVDAMHDVEEAVRDIDMPRIDYIECVDWVEV